MRKVQEEKKEEKMKMKMEEEHARRMLRHLKGECECVVVVRRLV
jgi:hypothetical protein